jgi:hypothetical protein
MYNDEPKSNLILVEPEPCDLDFDSSGFLFSLFNIDWKSYINRKRRVCIVPAPSLGWVN